LVIVGLAAIFHVGEHMAVLPIGCEYVDGVKFLKWPSQRCIVSSRGVQEDARAYDQDPSWDCTWYWPWWRMSQAQAYTLMALGVVWIALRKRES
jgi:hypothetical protein